VDDGSTDRTPEIVRKFQARVRLIQKTNGGQASAFSAGIPEARGRLLHSSADDWWAREKISVVMDYLAARPHIGDLDTRVLEPLGNPFGPRSSLM
jgi:glycosyltransferase involved in cell wall biosynthesis